jgi:hypothetical protein
MFMFRLALYLYALKFDAKRPTLAQTLAYFFMVPNVCFPLFPVIDYSTFVRTYYDREPGRIYELGIRWIVRGLLHLILYRLVYLHIVGDPGQVRTLGDLVQFMLATFLLYLRVSGQFHLIVGVLHLYGFHLPETHHLYFLASGFTDFWRRINIYWKDFMMKLVYYPSYFQLRRWNGNAALILSTVIVFFATWLLHSYQWFWLRGGFPVEPQDILFWSILGALVVFASVREMKQKPKRARPRGPAWSATLALRRVGTFTVITVLWSLWSAESVGAWLAMLPAAGNASAMDLIVLAAALSGGLLVAGREWSVREMDESATGPIYRRLAVQSSALLIVMVIMGYPDLYSAYTPRIAMLTASLQHSTLNARDIALQHKGYYEKLDNVSRLSAQLWDVQAKKPAGWVPLASTAAYRVRSDFLLGDLHANSQIVFEDQPFSTNRWGMRDRDYVQPKPKGTYRIALLGPSHVMGSGVADGETFADFLEESLNESMAQGSVRFEVLNFGVAGYSLLQQLAMLEDRVLAFQPDAIFVTDSPGLRTPMINHLAAVVMLRLPIPFSQLQTLVDEAGIAALANDGFPVPYQPVRALLGGLGIETRMTGREATERLSHVAERIVQWTFQRMVLTARENNAVPVFVALDIVRDLPIDEAALQNADAAGLIVFNLYDLWRNRDKSQLRVADWDEHPNGAANQLIAARLRELMEQHKSELRLPLHGEKHDTAITSRVTAVAGRQ